MQNKVSFSYPYLGAYAKVYFTYIQAAGNRATMRKTVMFSGYPESATYKKLTNSD